MDSLPDEIIEKILVAAVSFENACETYRNIMNVNKRFKRIIEEKGKNILPEIHVSADKFFNKMPMRNGKIKVSVRRLRNEFGEGSGLLRRISDIRTRTRNLHGCCSKKERESIGTLLTMCITRARYP